MVIKTLLTGFAFAIAISSSANSEPASEKCEIVKCRDSKCGCELRKIGWTEIARCSGHQWRYVIEKDGHRKLCQGINERGGPTEDACQKFDGDLSEFKLCKGK